MQKKILVIDNEPDIAIIVTPRLKQLGYLISHALDAEKALSLLLNEIHDLILMDLVLPKMKGEELCKKLKSDEKHKKTPIIVFTASLTPPSIIEKVKEIGADDYLLKPFEPEELLSKVKKFIG